MSQRKVEFKYLDTSQTEWYTLHLRVQAARARLMREVSTLARLHHPGIVRYYQARLYAARVSTGCSCCLC